MPLYEYECQECKYKFDHRLPMSRRDEAIACPKCKGTTKRLISGGTGFIIKGGTRVGIARDFPAKKGKCCKEQGKENTCCAGNKGDCGKMNEGGCGSRSCEGH